MWICIPKFEAKMNSVKKPEKRPVSVYVMSSLLSIMLGDGRGRRTTSLLRCSVDITRRREREFAIIYTEGCQESRKIT